MTGYGSFSPLWKAHREGFVRETRELAGPGWPGKCPGLREARPSSERAAIPRLLGSQLELGQGGVLEASALVLHSHLAIIRLARRIPVKRARLLGWIKVKGRLAERTPMPRPHTTGPHSC